MVLGQASFRTSPTKCADSAAFKAFYSGLLFWTFEPGRINDGWQVQGTHPMAGVAGGSSGHVTVPMWTVADIDAAVARVREAGGTVIDEPSQQSYGRSALVHRRSGHTVLSRRALIAISACAVALSATEHAEITGHCEISCGLCCSTNTEVVVCAARLRLPTASPTGLHPAPFCSRTGVA